MSEQKEINYFSKGRIFGYIVAIMVLGFVLNSVGIFQKHAYTSMENAVINYEEFQEIYNTCQKIDTDIAIIQGVPNGDVMFEQFSKAQRLATLKVNLNKWVENYNAKSKMFNRSIWKSNSLPHQLDINDFINYRSLK